MGQVSTRSCTKEWPMPTFITVQCPHCHRDQVVNRGKTARGPPRDLCQKKACATGRVLLDATNRGCLPEVQERIIDLSLHASGMRDTARALPSSTDTGLSALKKQGTGIGGSQPHTAERAASGRGARRQGASRGSRDGRHVGVWWPHNHPPLALACQCSSDGNGVSVGLWPPSR